MGRIERGAITPLTRTDVPASLLAVLKKGMAVLPPIARVGGGVRPRASAGRARAELCPTTIEVPNLVVPEPERDAGSSEDETRARGHHNHCGPDGGTPAADAANVRSYPGNRGPRPRSRRHGRSRSRRQPARVRC